MIWVLCTWEACERRLDKPLNLVMVVNDIGYAAVAEGGANAPTLRGEGSRRHPGDVRIHVSYSARGHYIWSLSKPARFAWLPDQVPSKNLQNLCSNVSLIHLDCIMFFQYFNDIYYFRSQFFSYVSFAHDLQNG